jgi:hypothetical protein
MTAWTQGSLGPLGSCRSEWAVGSFPLGWLAQGHEPFSGVLASRSGERLFETLMDLSQLCLIHGAGQFLWRGGSDFPFGDNSCQTPKLRVNKFHCILQRVTPVRTRTWELAHHLKAF